jgi:hypothetical protein
MTVMLIKDTPEGPADLKRTGNLWSKNTRMNLTPLRNILTQEKNTLNMGTQRKVKMAIKISMRLTSSNRIAIKTKELTPSRKEKCTNTMIKIDTTKRLESHTNIIK